jgi:hypothetical protein
MVGLNPKVFGQFMGIVCFTSLTAISLGKKSATYPPLQGQRIFLAFLLISVSIL